MNIANPASTYPVHPGQILKDELKARRIKHKKFAKLVGIEVHSFSDLMRGRRSVTTKLAIIIAVALNAEVEAWINHKTQYDLGTALLDPNLQMRLRDVIANREKILAPVES